MAKLVQMPHVPVLGVEDSRLLIESIQDYAIFMLDAEGFVATWNRGAERIKGYKADEIIGRHFSLFFPDADVEAGKPDTELKLALEHGRTEDEGWRIKKDGSRFWANVVITALRDENGRLRGFAKITRDLTERREAEQKIRVSDERTRLLIAAVQDYAIYMLDPTGHVTTWNSGAQRLKGYTSDEICGQHFERFFPEQARHEGKPQRELELALSQGRFEEEGWRVRKDGSCFWANIVITPVHDEHGTLLGFAKVTRDLTERMHAEATARHLLAEQTAREVSEANERQLRSIARELEDANRVKDEFLATVSHELRTPLNAILGWSALLLARPDAQGLKGLNVIHRNAEAQAKLIDDILDVSRIITGKLHLDLQTVDLSAIVRDATDVVRPAAAARRQTLLLNASGPSRMVGDPVRLQQIAWNLLSNAVKFTPEGGQVAVAVEQHGSKLTLRVSDTGRGIEGGFLPFLFDRFSQADSTTTRRVGGLGLGLSIVKHLVDLHGGQIEAQSDGPGLGSTFTVTLPIRALVPSEEAALSGAGAAQHGQSKLTLAGTRVLVVEDEDDARDLLTTILEGAGCVVSSAASAAEAIEQLQEARPQVLISDIAMPNEDGYALMRRIRARGRSDGGDIPSIALTAYTSAADRTNALQAGFTTHLPKPVRSEDLLAALHNLTVSYPR